MPATQKAIIIGAGPAGLAAALHLHQQNGIHPVVYELRTEPTTLGGAVGIFSNGLRLLHRLGVYEAIAARGSKTAHATLYSSQGVSLGSADLVAWSEEQTGFGQMRIKRTDLLDVLLDAVHRKDIPIHWGKRIVNVDDTATGITATFEDGTTDTADLLLGCDGIHSSVRKMYVDPGVVPEYSGLSGIFSILPVSSLPSPPPPAAVSGLNATLTPDGLFAVIPCNASGDHLYWFFSHEVPIPTTGDTRDGWEEHRRKELDAFKTYLLHALEDVKGDWGAFLTDIVKATQAVKFYPTYRLPLGRSWSKGRCLLLGDAAHAMQPHAGQGVSMALEDVFLLSRLLKDSPAREKEIFDKFEQIRRPRIERYYKQAQTSGDSRKRSGPWAMWVKEWAAWSVICVIRMFSLDKWGLWQTSLVYDIDRVEIK